MGLSGPIVQVRKLEPKNILELHRSQIKATQIQLHKTSSSMLLPCIVRCMSPSRRISWFEASQPSEGDARTNPKRSSEMQEHRTEERKKERSIKHHVTMRMPFFYEEALRPRTKSSSTQKRFSEETRPRQEHSSQKDFVQKNVCICGHRSPNGIRKQERSSSGARDPERTLGSLNYIISKRIFRYSRVAQWPLEPIRPSPIC